MGRAMRPYSLARGSPPPLYSPDLPPIEKLWSKVKEGLRPMAGRTMDAVFGAMQTTGELMRPQDILDWFRSCGLCTT